MIDYTVKYRSTAIGLTRCIRILLQGSTYLLLNILKLRLDAVQSFLSRLDGLFLRCLRLIGRAGNTVIMGLDTIKLMLYLDQFDTRPNATAKGKANIKCFISFDL